jgi:hypothetical protein
MKSTSNASEIYRHFKQLPGSQYMATEKAIKGVAEEAAAKSYAGGRGWNRNAYVCIRCGPF